MNLSPVMMQNLLSLKNAMGERVNITDAEWMMMMPRLEFLELEKNTLLVAEGEVEQYVYFIAEGVTRSFFERNNRDISFEFYFSGMFISSYASFLTRTPSGHSIEAFTAGTFLRIHYNQLMELYGESKNFEQLGRVITEELFKKTSERNKDLLALSATERYQKLLTANPHYVQQIPLKYLASYLNITPESLSRIRKTL